MGNQLYIRKSGNTQNVYPKNYTDNIKYSNDYKNLTEILEDFNCYFLSYTNSPEETRIQLPQSLRKRGIWITYIDNESILHVEYYTAVIFIDTEFQKNENWISFQDTVQHYTYENMSRYSLRVTSESGSKEDNSCDKGSYIKYKLYQTDTDNTLKGTIYTINPANPYFDSLRVGNLYDNSKLPYVVISDKNFSIKGLNFSVCGGEFGHSVINTSQKDPEIWFFLDEMANVKLLSHYDNTPGNLVLTNFKILSNNLQGNTTTYIDSEGYLKNNSIESSRIKTVNLEVDNLNFNGYNLNAHSIVESAEYDKENVKINFYNSNKELVSSIDASDFIKDGMISSISVEDNRLVLTFNTDAGSEKITLDISKIFNANNYYTKIEVNALIAIMEPTLVTDITKL